MVCALKGKEYIDEGIKRIGLLKKELLKTRPINETIYTTNGKDSVSKYPTEWLELRLKGIEEQQNKLKEEAESIRNIISKSTN